MAIETLKGIERIGEFDVCHVEADEFRCEADGHFVLVDHDTNCLNFHLQNGPVKENGVNGCQVDTIIAAAEEIVRGLNEKFPCRENEIVIQKLAEAVFWLEMRKADRVDRGVEGTNQG